DRISDTGDGVLGVRGGAVARASGRRESQPCLAALGVLDRIEASGLVDREGEPSTLADRLGDAVEDLRAVLDQVLRSVNTAALLIGDEEEYEVPRRHRPGASQMSCDGEEHRDGVLHVDGSAAPQVAVLDDAL